MGETAFFSIMRFLPVFAFLLVSYLSYMALVRWIPFFRPVNRRIIFWVLAFFSILPLVYSIVTGFQDAQPWLRFAYYPAIAWNIAQIIFLVSLPILFILHRYYLSEKNKDKKELQKATKEDNKKPNQEDKEERTSKVHLPDPLTRRRFIEGSITAVPFVALAVATQGTLVGDTRVVTRTFPITVPGLSKELDGLRLLQISDVHLGTFFPLNRWEEAIEMIAKEKPDILTITGDYVDDLTLLRPALAMADQLHPSLGSYYCLGNHEHYRGLKEVRAAFADSSIVNLENSSMTIADGQLCMVGVDYPFARQGLSRVEVRSQMLDQALQNAPEGVPRVLLTHHPDFFDEARMRGVELTLAGHTHGGQVGIGSRSFFPWALKYMRGWYGDEQSKLFVNSGLGHWLPFRLGCPSEIITVVLRRP
ncbi:metallophosphoesterase [Heliorestis convoluta]|uniref:Metallophosphoesterase n=1 Tax=Heliorestis convoluta TaxID=356322 RepID=A0A5Q2N1Q3_9FIRM|nr:metallophosphoesterase [Heliorestis convoluta]QGG49314.1 metallophosphoesterase [Heliorestis convoluta]